MKYEVRKNFLNSLVFLQLQDLIIKNDFPWFKRNYQAPNKNKIDLGYFTHSFYNNNIITSKYYESYILPILKQLNARSIIEVRANLTPSVFYLERASAFHCDYKIKSSKTAILYLNNCNGGTEIKIDNKIEFIKAEENKILIFDSDIEHRGVVSKDTDFRYILNFNYFENIIE